MNLEFLKQTLAVQTTSRDETMMREYIRRVVRDIEGAELTMDSHGNIFVVKGKADQYPCVVAHQDTVHQIHKSFKVFQDGSTLFAFWVTILLILWTAGLPFLQNLPLKALPNLLLYNH